jgi:hypothetical protein
MEHSIFEASITSWAQRGSIGTSISIAKVNPLLLTRASRKKFEKRA